MTNKDLEDLFAPYGKIVGVSLFRGYGFVQFERLEEAEAARAAQTGRIYKGYKLDVNMAVERRQAKPQSQQSPPRRPLYGKEGRPRSRSPVYGRDGRDPRDSRDARDSAREPRPGSHSRDPDYRYRSESRDKDMKGEPRDPAYSRDDYDRYFRGGSAVDDYYRRKDEPYRDPYLDPWNGRREAGEDRARPEERRRNELYRQYYEELQRRYDIDRPVDCSVIVVNKAQNREYAETVGRKVRDLGMVVDLIFLNTEVSLTQALEDVGRARTPFAIIITQQHQVHRSCTVNILFGTPQEHRNMPMQDAMMLVAHNYDTYKVENREKEREEIARKAAKMADDVLIRELDRENHPISVLTSITLLAENRFLTPEELDGLIAYLKDKRARLVRPSEDPLTAHSASAAPHRDVLPSAAGLAPPSHAASQPSHLSATSSTSANPSHQQELQAKILSLFNSGSGPLPGSTAGSQGAPQSHSYSSLGPASSQNQSQGYSMPSRLHPPSTTQRPASGINFDNPSVQKALDTLIQSGPSLNNLVTPGSAQSMPQRSTPSMGQGPSMSMYPRHY